MSVYCKFGGGRPDYLTKQSIGMAKPLAYNMNGSGRDTYIACNNGGLSCVYEPAAAPDIGTFTSKK